MLHTCRHSICDSAVSNQAKEEILYGPAVCEQSIINCITFCNQILKLNIIIIIIIVIIII